MTPDDRPFCRAAIRGRTVTLNRWAPGMAGRGPLRDGLRHARAALADLRREGEDNEELIVTPVRGARWDARAERALVGWARLVGYRRVWLPGEVVTFEDELVPLGGAAVDCPTCGARWEDGSFDFWEHVWRNHWFPASCLGCGGSLPEWALVVEDGVPAPAKRPARTAPSRR